MQGRDISNRELVQMGLLLTPLEASAYSGKSLSWVRKAIKCGKLTTKKYGRREYIELQSLLLELGEVQEGQKLQVVVEVKKRPLPAKAAPKRIAILGKYDLSDLSI